MLTDLLQQLLHQKQRPIDPSLLLARPLLINFIVLLQLLFAMILPMTNVLQPRTLSFPISCLVHPKVHFLLSCEWHTLF